MSNKRNVRLFLDDMLRSAKFIVQLTNGYTEDSFRKDIRTLHAVLYDFAILGEAANQIPPNIRNKYPDVRWNLMVGFRNKVTHDYFGIITEVVWDTIIQDIPPLIEQLSHVIAQEEADSR